MSPSLLTIFVHQPLTVLPPITEQPALSPSPVWQVMLLEHSMPGHQTAHGVALLETEYLILVQY